MALWQITLFPFPLQEEEKRRFLSLSDREKRALAAERRILAAASESGAATVAVLSRCYQCGADISGKGERETFCCLLLVTRLILPKSSI